MQAANDRIIHSYDTERHAARCGAAGQSSSTKHANGVTCPDCLKILADNKRDEESTEPRGATR
jgi:nitrate/TMAO reductase-like tetraheme cytochrome c subunit